MHHPFSECGHAIAIEGWGTNKEQPREGFIREMTDERKIVCLMSAAVEELVAIRKLLSEKPRHPNVTDVADGILRSMRPKEPVESVSLKTLSVRARKTLTRLGMALKDITPECLASVRGCGPTTIDEIMTLKEAHFPTDIPEPICEIDPIVGSSLPRIFEHLPEPMKDQK